MKNKKIKKYIIIIRKFIKKLKKDRIGEYSAECAYYTIFSFMPFIIFLITLIKYTIIEKEIVFNLFKNIIPSNMHNFLIDIMNEVYSKTINTISISLFISLWSSSRIFYSISKSIKNIYKISENKSNFIIRIESLICTIVFMISLLIVLILIVLGNRIYDFILKNYFSFGRIVSILLKIRSIIVITILFCVFLTIYKFISKNKENLKIQLPGVIFSSIVWVVISYMFSKCIEIFNGFSNIYGSLSSIILILMWIYACMYIILLGAEINIFLKEVKIKKSKRR